MIVLSFIVSQCDVREGGLVPKSLYRSVEFGEGDEFSLGHEIYQAAYVTKGSPHEVRSLATDLHVRTGLSNLLP